MNRLEIAELYKQELQHKLEFPKDIVSIAEDQNAFQGLRVIPQNRLDMPLILNSGDAVILDFGTHMVGYLNYTVNFRGKIADSPTKLRFTFAEMPCEIATPPEEYHGTLGNGWLQNETAIIPVLPYAGRPERRYAFRYVKVERIDNAKFTVTIERIFCDTVSAVLIEDAIQSMITDLELKEIDRIAVTTLKECMQDVFEDGPKRDRRLWIGDFRLQALTNYVTFQNIRLVKRCLYLFAENLIDSSIVAPYVFPDSPPYVDEWTFTDYSLFFVSCLADYALYTDDLELPGELYDIAFQQLQNGKELLTDSGMNGNFFVDWCPNLDKQTAGTAIYLYVLRQAQKLAVQLHRELGFIQEEIARAGRILLGFYDPAAGLFTSGAGKQLSWASQIWAVLSGVLGKTESKALLLNTVEHDPEYKIHTPYMMHYYLEALFECGLDDIAEKVIKGYWGGMVKSGADCFYEVYNPDNDRESPYLDYVINSACHAWSCTPSYWIRTRLNPAAE